MMPRFIPPQCGSGKIGVQKYAQDLLSTATGKRVDPNSGPLGKIHDGMASVIKPRKPRVLHVSALGKNAPAMARAPSRKQLHHVAAVQHQGKVGAKTTNQAHSMSQHVPVGPQKSCTHGSFGKYNTLQISEQPQAAVLGGEQADALARPAMGIASDVGHTDSDASDCISMDGASARPAGAHQAHAVEEDCLLQDSNRQSEQKTKTDLDSRKRAQQLEVLATVQAQAKATAEARIKVAAQAETRKMAEMAQVTSKLVAESPSSNPARNLSTRLSQSDIHNSQAEDCDLTMHATGTRRVLEEDDPRKSQRFT
jgi:hypothetical protein